MQPDPIQAAAAALKQAGILFVENEPLKKHTSFCIGGPAAIFAAPSDAKELAACIHTASKSGIPHMLLGKGSNILFKDEGYPGMIVHMGKALGEISVEGDTITAGAGADLGAVCVAAQKAGLAGLEFAYGIPGSVGGAVYMNAGAYGGEMCDVIQSVVYLDENGVVQSAPLAALELGYRTSIFQTKPWPILSATLRMQAGEKGAILAAMQDYMQRRTDKQPLDKPSAGSAFKRPPGAFAGALIDECGLRGFRVGDAAISEKHCGFIVNLGNATCGEVLELARQVSEKVEAETGYVLEKEVRVVDPGV